MRTRRKRSRSYPYVSRHPVPTKTTLIACKSGISVRAAIRTFTTPRGLTRVPASPVRRVAVGFSFVSFFIVFSISVISDDTTRVHD